MQVKFKLDIGITDSTFNGLSFGRQMEFLNKIKLFKSTAKHVYISQKRITNSAAIKEFKKLYNPTQFYCTFEDNKYSRDDSFQMWFTQKETDDYLPQTSGCL